MTARFKAGELAGKAAAVVGGKGGGRPDLAQAGGPDVTKIDEAVTAFKGFFV
jgi:alanyl-tRNA synthetase